MGLANEMRRLVDLYSSPPSKLHDNRRYFTAQMGEETADEFIETKVHTAIGWDRR